MKKPASKPPLPRVVPQREWQRARARVLKMEKALTDAHDALAAERRRLPMVRIDKDYSFDGPRGKVRLLDLFEGRSQLVLYHFMFAPGVGGWPDAGCPGCSFVIDQICHPAHLHARDLSFAIVSRAPLRKILAYRKRMGWTLPWVSSAKSTFNDDFGLSTKQGEIFGLSVFLRDGEDIYRTYFTNGRGVETLGPAWTFFDIAPYGRQEDWENSPKGWPQGPRYVWWRRHDEYGDAKPPSRQRPRKAT
jgi:predicted dithiol-disulfide oxidoreductase (DUF899 family)